MRRRPEVLGFLAIIVLALAGLCLAYLFAPDAAQLDTAREKTTQKRFFVVAISPEGGEPTVGPLGSWILELRSPDGIPVSGATISVDGGMPDHNHGLPTTPTVSADLGDGRYRVEGVKFSMPGHWVLKFKIVAPGGRSDEAVLNVVL